MVTPPSPKASSLAPSCGYQRREQHSQPAHRGQPAARSTISKLHTGLRRIPSAHRPASSGPEHETTPSARHDLVRHGGTTPPVAGRACAAGRSAVITAAIPALGVTPGWLLART